MKTIKKKVIQLADSFAFWEMPENPEAENEVIPCPGITTFHIRTKEHNKIVNFYYSFKNQWERSNIKGLERAIFDIVHQKSEYLAMPPRKRFRL
jgi:hypothetical protein